MDDTNDSSQISLGKEPETEEMSINTVDKEREMAELLITMDKYTPIVNTFSVATLKLVL